MGSKGNDFRWFDQPAKVVKNQDGTVQYTPAKEGALSLIGKTMTGVAAPFAGDYQWLERQNQARTLSQSQESDTYQKILEHNRKLNDPVELYKDLEAKAKLSALLKQQKNQALTEFEKHLIGYKEDVSDKPNDMELWRQAYKQAVTRLGGSDMVGLSPEKGASLNTEVQNEYLGLKKQFGTETPEERLMRARNYLKTQGYASSNEMANTFLEKNKDF